MYQPLLGVCSRTRAPPPRAPRRSSEPAPYCKSCRVSSAATEHARRAQRHSQNQSCAPSRWSHTWTNSANEEHQQAVRRRRGASNSSPCEADAPVGAPIKQNPRSWREAAGPCAAARQRQGEWEPRLSDSAARRTTTSPTTTRCCALSGARAAGAAAAKASGCGKAACSAIPNEVFWLPKSRRSARKRARRGAPRIRRGGARAGGGAHSRRPKSTNPPPLGAADTLDGTDVVRGRTRLRRRVRRSHLPPRSPTTTTTTASTCWSRARCSTELPLLVAGRNRRRDGVACSIAWHKTLAPCRLSSGAVRVPRPQAMRSSSTAAQVASGSLEVRERAPGGRARDRPQIRARRR